MPSRLASELLAEVEGRDGLSVPVEARGLQVAQETASLGDELQKPAARVVVFQVSLEVLGQVTDALREEGNLHFRGSGIGLVGAKLGDELDCLLGMKRHNVLSRKMARRSRNHIWPTRPGPERPRGARRRPCLWYAEDVRPIRPFGRRAV